ncbi:MAG: PIN domain-containing protein, partial [Candidatus Thermoplasmatota archaeon]|nr:PIN domain-containing protein [Candidatus Thermoplasmatota archaeon]
IEKADEIFTSTLCAYEVYLGESYSRLKGIRPKVNVTEFFDNIEIIDFTLDDARKSSEIKALLRARGEEVNVLDILIASSAYSLELTVITKDRDFQTISHYMDLDVILSL